MTPAGPAYHWSVAERFPLEDQDIRILEIEGPTIVGHTCKVVRLASPGVEFHRFFETVGARIESVPELTWKLDPGPGPPAWVRDDGFDLNRHLVLLEDGRPLAEGEIAAASSRLFAEKLDRNFPLWRIDFAQNDDGGTTLIWRIHHALADGTTAMRIGREILWHPAAEPEPTASVTATATVKTEATAAATAAAKAKRLADDDIRRRRHLLGLFEREFTRTKGPSPFDGVICTDRSLAFATISLSAIHDAGKKAAGATLNDSVLSVVAGAIRHWMELHHEEAPGTVRVRVPVSLHQGDDEGGNRDSFFSIPLPIHEPDPIRRLTEIREETEVRKMDHDAEELDSILRKVSHTSPRLSHFYSKFEANPRRFALNISNVRGPSRPVMVLEAPVETVHSIAEIGERHALRIAALSIGDRLCFGFCADPDLVRDLEVMAEGIERATERLVEAAEGLPGS